MAQRDFVTSADWTLESLLAMGPRFRPVSRIAISDPDLDTYLLDYERTDIPMVIEGLEKHPKWPSEMFDIQWFLQHGPQDLQARNVYDRTDVPISLSDFIAKSRSAGPRASPDEYERLYAKDVECPSRWESWLGEGAVIPPLLCPEGPADIMKHLPQPERVENLMCYLGIGDTFTPCHKDLCASSGHNLMCYTEGSASAFWFMTDGAAAPAAAAYFQSLDQELDWENHTISLDELANAPFEVYITEQKVGDFVLVPPRSCHQVVNHGGLTVKMSWSRMTLRGVGVALHHELPIYRRVCRPETYRIKSTIHHTLLHHTAQLENASMSEDTASEDMNSSEVDPLRIALELERLLELFQEIMVDEYHPRPDSLRRIVTTFNHEAHTSGRYEAYTCDFCGSDIFLSFFLCQSCAPPSPLDSMSPGPADGIHICPGCYSEGRTCRCRSMTPVQSWPVEVLVDDYNRAVRALRALGAEEWEELLGLGELHSEEYIGLFEAADAVRRMCTNAKPGDSRCHAIKHGHTKPAAESLNCKRCHHSRCFVHLAGIGIHSSQAVVAHQKSTDHRYWHNLHRSLRDSFVRNKPNILAAEMSGDGFSNLMGHRLAIAATTFPHCQPVDILNTRHGWYDQALPNLSIPSLSIRIPPTHIRPSDDSMDVSPKSPDWNWQSNDLSPDDEEGLSPLSSIDATSDNVTVVQDAQPSLPPPRKGR
ncbi:hypothetical protein BV25DRAFT_1881865 [Artomyces pyxidatus]|uniref:Uncharacterized protein n=1 Tax=Artomyces pyxidatus TaxID=48021 RepID=A0ACB8T730_9AGAM|nr:hypothetical protein BV25DRAFT_1881865 [Artomyces pyxidatus]